RITVGLSLCFALYLCSSVFLVAFRFSFVGFRFLALFSRSCGLRMLRFMLLLLSDFLRVCDVSRVSHQLIDGFQRFAGRISERDCSRGFAHGEMITQGRARGVIAAHAVN